MRGPRALRHCITSRQTKGEWGGVAVEKLERVSRVQRVRVQRVRVQRDSVEGAERFKRVVMSGYEWL